MNRTDQFRAPYIATLRTNPAGYGLASGLDEAKLVGTDTFGEPVTVELTRAMYDPTTVRASLMAVCPKDRRDVVLAGVRNGSIAECFAKAWALLFASGATS